MPDPISHAEMIAAVQLAIERLEIDVEDGEPVVKIASALVIDSLQAVLAHLERTQWWDIEDRAPKDGRVILIGGPGWWTPARWSEVNYVGVGDPKWITIDGHGTRAPTHYMIPLPPSPETP